jgi:hypothetical protein
MLHHLQCFSTLLYGGHAQGAFGRAGLLASRSTNLRYGHHPSFGSVSVMAPFYDARSFIHVQVTPNPPDTDPASPYESLDLSPGPHIMATPRKPSSMFIVNPDLNLETLLVHACESLASANVMATDLVDHLEGTSRNALLGIAQVIMLGELAVNRAQDQLDPP